jgi:hypothetical protein
VWAWIFLCLPSAIGVAIVLTLLNIDRPTAFDLELSVDGVAFEAAPGSHAVILGKTPFNLLRLHGVEQGDIEGKRLTALDPALTSKVLPSSTLSLKRNPQADGGLGSQINLGPAVRSAGALGSLDPLRLDERKRAEFAVIGDTPRALSLRIIDQPVRVLASLSQDSLADVSNALLRSATGSAQSAAWIEAPEVRLRIERTDRGASAQVQSVPAGATLHINPSLGSATVPLLPEPIRVSALDFTRRGANNGRVSTLVGEGKISYPDVPGEKSILVGKQDFLVVAINNEFSLRSVEFNQSAGRFVVKAGGVAASLRSGPDRLLRERSLNWFDWLRSRSWIAQGLAIVTWLSATVFAARKLFKDLSA